MKKKILSASLKLIPNALQYKALIKALNYLFCGQAQLARFAGLSVRLELIDIKRGWEFVCDGRSLSQYEGSAVDVVCLFDSGLALELRSKNSVLQAIDDNRIQFVGESAYVAEAKAMLCGLEVSKIEHLVQRFREFLRLKPIENTHRDFDEALLQRATKLGIDLDYVTVDHVTNKEAVDLVRDAALALEKTDLPEALRLMEIAKQKRPSGPVISRKVEEYQALLTS